MRVLEHIEVRPLYTPAGPRAEAAARAWIAAQKDAGLKLQASEVFQAVELEYAIVACAPPAGGQVSAETEINVCRTPVPALNRVQLMYLGDDCVDNDNALYPNYIRPLLVQRREARRQEGGRGLLAVAKDLVLNASGRDFGVYALDPAGQYGVIDEKTDVFVSCLDTSALAKVHVLPYEDTLPAAYQTDIFRDLLQPFFQAHPFAVYGKGDHFNFRGVRFRIMATEPADVHARINNNTLVYTEGDVLRPTMWELMPPEVRSNLQRLPRGVQALLLNTVANEEAIHSRLIELHQVLEKGQGLDKADINKCGATSEWRQAEHSNDTQQQCMVCLSDFVAGDCVRRLQCEHLFHRDCIDEWLQRSAVCPICKRPVGKDASNPGISLLLNAWVTFDGCRQGKVINTDINSQKLQIEEVGRGTVGSIEVERCVQHIAGVRLQGLKSAELNGSTGQIVGFDPSIDRYQLRLNGGDRVIAVRADNCVLPDGTVARVIGLRMDGPAARWNGQYGRIIGISEGRHILDMPTHRRLAVMPRNLRV